MSNEHFDWKTHVRQFVADFEQTRIENPDWTLEQIAKSLNKSSRTTHRMLAVFRNLDDIRISNSVTLNQAYGKIKTYYQTPTKAVSEITNIMNSLVPTGSNDK